MLRLQHKSIVIVGGTSGLGLSAAKACLAEGASIVVVGRSADKAQPLIEAAPDRVRLVVGDASLPEASASAIEAAVQSYGRLDGLYHVAGGSGRSRGDGPLHQVPDDGWSATLRLNLDSVFYSNRAALQQFIQQDGGGVILNMASVLGFAPSPRYFATHAYAAAKAAIIGLTRAAAAHYASQKIRVNAVAPSLVETPMAHRALGDEQIVAFVRRRQPLGGGRIGQPEDLDGAVVLLLSDESSFMTGQVVAVDGGWSVCDAGE